MGDASSVSASEGGVLRCVVGVGATLCRRRDILAVGERKNYKEEEEEEEEAGLLLKSTLEGWMWVAGWLGEIVQGKIQSQWSEGADLGRRGVIVPAHFFRGRGGGRPNVAFWDGR